MMTVKHLLRYLLGVFLILAGVMHFVRLEFYERMMPPYLPWHRELVLVSGVCEIGLGFLLLVPAWSRGAAWGVIALLIAVFPANIHIYLHQDLLPSIGPVMHFLRLPFQGVLILWAYWYTRGERGV